MKRSPASRIRHVAAVVALLMVTAAVPSPSALAAATRQLGCKSADLRYPFTRGGPKTFGVFDLKIAGGTCATAHTVAKDWMKRFEAALRAGHVRLPRSIDGFSFTTLPAKAAQEYRERGQKSGTTIRFEYRVPNG
jgi:hypothetical protein